MKCLTKQESEDWLNVYNVKLGQNRSPIFPVKTKHRVLTTPNKPFNISHFSISLFNWLPKQKDYFFWLYDWDTVPSHQISIIEAIRGNYNEKRPLIEAPGFLFSKDDVSDHKILTGLIFLVCSFGWSAYFIPSDDECYFILNDSILIAHSNRSTDIEMMEKLASVYELEIWENKKMGTRYN